MTIFEYKFYFIFNLTIQSNNLGVFRLNNKRSLRLELMNHLNNIGYSNREITDFLNVSNIKKVRTNTKYTPKDVFMGIKKYRQRLNRFTNNQIISLRERVYLEKFFNKDWLYEYLRIYSLIWIIEKIQIHKREEEYL